jgi:hypothetical protein
MSHDSNPDRLSSELVDELLAIKKSITPEVALDIVLSSIDRQIEAAKNGQITSVISFDFPSYW